MVNGVRRDLSHPIEAGRFTPKWFAISLAFFRIFGPDREGLRDLECKILPFRTIDDNKLVF